MSCHDSPSLVPDAQNVFDPQEVCALESQQGLKTTEENRGGPSGEWTFDDCDAIAGATPTADPERETTDPAMDGGPLTCWG